MTSAAHIHLVNLRRSGGFETDRRRIPYTKEFCHCLHHFKEPSRVISRPKTVPKKKVDRIISHPCQWEWCILNICIYVCNILG